MTLEELIAQTCDPADIRAGSIWAPYLEPGVLRFRDKFSQTYRIRVADNREDANRLALELNSLAKIIQKLLGS